MVYPSRRSVWIAASALVAAVSTTNNSGCVTASTQTRLPFKQISIDMEDRKPPTTTTTVEEEEEKERLSILIKTMSKQAWEDAKLKLIATTTKITPKTPTTPPPPDGIYVNKPVLRGQFHKWGAILFPPCFFLPLCWKAWEATKTNTSSTIPCLFRNALLFCVAIESVMAISATLHTYPWKTEANHQTCRKLDFTGIFFGIAGCYSSIGRMVLGEHHLWGMIETTVWVCAILGTYIKWKVPDAPHWANALVFLVQGWATLPAAPLLFSGAISTSTGLSLVAGGIFVTLGALAYSLQWPFNTQNKQPFEIVFGPHEVFHVGSLLAFFSLTVTMWTRISELSGAQ